jgi:hypothetical protein
MHEVQRHRSAAPIVAAALALAYPAAVAVGAWVLAGVTVTAAVAGCAAVLTRRPSRALRMVLAAIVAWLVLGIGGAFLLHGHPVRGFAWVLVVLYAVPLPVIPWLYAATFGATDTEGRRETVDGRGTTRADNETGLSSSLFPLPSHQTKRDP